MKLAFLERLKAASAALETIVLTTKPAIQSVVKSVQRIVAAIETRVTDPVAGILPKVEVGVEDVTGEEGVIANVKAIVAGGRSIVDHTKDGGEIIIRNIPEEEGGGYVVRLGKPPEGAGP